MCATLEMQTHFGMYRIKRDNDIVIRNKYIMHSTFVM